MIQWEIQNVEGIFFSAAWGRIHCERNYMMKTWMYYISVCLLVLYDFTVNYLPETNQIDSDIFTELWRRRFLFAVADPP